MTLIINIGIIDVSDCEHDRSSPTLSSGVESGDQIGLELLALEWWHVDASVT
jgi:hypothetical protein